MPALVLGEPTGERVVLSSGGRTLRVLDLDSGLVTPIEGRYESTLFARKNGIVVRSTEQEFSYLPLTGDGTATALRVAGDALPAAEDDRVWLIREASRNAAEVVQVDLAGRETMPPYRLQRGAYVSAAVDEGLIISSAGRLFLWSSSTRSVRLLAEGADTLATSARTIFNFHCDDNMRCGLAFLDVATGRQRRVEVLDDLADRNGWEYQATFSPDGETLLVIPWPNTGNTLRFGYLDVATLELTWIDVSLRDGQDTSGWINSPRWSSNGEWIFWCDGYLNAHRVGTDAVHRVAFANTNCDFALPLQMDSAG